MTEPIERQVGRARRDSSIPAASTRDSKVPPKAPEPRMRGVLVVENDPDLQWGLARMLTVLGHRVVGTSSSDGALALLAEWPVDLVLLAEDLPGMDGLELARHVRERAPGVPVILLANDGPGVSDAANAAGVSAYLVKPFRLETLRDLVVSLDAANRGGSDLEG